MAKVDHAEFGWAARPFIEQFPFLPADKAEQFDKDSQAMTRLSMRGYLTPSQRDTAMKKITAALEKALVEAGAKKVA